jgi:hypothetical protein
MSLRRGVQLLAAASGARESPTALLFARGPLAPRADATALAAALSAGGFSCYSLDLLRPQFALCTSSVDDLVDRVHAGLQEARVCAPPVAVASFAEAFFFLKYLESFPLAGLVLIEPLDPLSPAPALHALLRGAGAAVRLPKTDACAPAAAASSTALAAALAPRARTPAAARVAAAFLLKLAADPVRLEPQPVPMLLLGDAADTGVRAAAAQHNLQPAGLLQPGAIEDWIRARF